MLGKVDWYRTPKGSQDIPHPRTIPDIISRTLFIHLCAVLAYALLLSTLKQSSSQDRKSKAKFPWIWPLCSVLLPELVLVKFGLWMIYKLFPGATRLLGVSSTRHVQRRHGTVDAAKRLNIVATLVQGLVLMTPLYFAYKGYGDRLAMRYHEANYVGNLGLDHRNGWTAISGLISCASIFALLLVATKNVVLNGQTGDHGTALDAPQSDSITAGEDKEEDEDLGHHEKRNDSNRKESNDWLLQTDNQAHASFGGAASRASSSRLTKLFISIEAMHPLLLAALIHQILLAVTNQVPPLVAFFTTAWCLSAVPVLCISFFLLPPLQRQTSWQAISLGKWSELSLPFSVLLQTTVIIASWLLIASTIIVQAWRDADELGSVGAEHMQAWNYRWRVKDRFSHGDSDRVYMG